MNQDYEIRGTITLGERLRPEERLLGDGQYTAATSILRRLYKLGEPGVILADEVGLGKTYVALGVAAWLLLDQRKARVLVLTNNRQMIETWAERWEKGIRAKTASALPPCKMAGSWKEYRSLRPSDRLGISSYEALKMFHDDWRAVRASLGEWLFQSPHHPGTRLGEHDVRRLKRGLGIDLRRGSEQLKRRPPHRAGRGFWRDHFDPVTRDWRDDQGARDAMDDLEIRYGAVSGKRPPAYDLVIVDEAHRLDSPGRRSAMDLLLNGQTKKILYVTATPFALDVNQLESLLGLFRFCKNCDAERLTRAIQEMGLRDFERAVAARQPFHGLADLEERLRRWIVRRTWPTSGGSMSRRSVVWSIPPDLSEGFASTLALERAIAELLRSEDRTHIASRRAGLCSSWAAAKRSFEDSPIGNAESEARRWADLATRLIRNSTKDSPKIREAVFRIVQEVKKGRKVLVFSERSESLSLLRRHLRKALEDLERGARRRNTNWREQWRRRRDRGDVAATREFWASTPVAAGRLGVSANDWRSLRREVRNLESRLNKEEQDYLLGRKTRPILRSVEILDGQRGDWHTQQRFNLPGMPWVLLCSKKAQESIDLHRSCNTIVLLDPVWNPAHREQRIGRVHRLMSRYSEVRVIDVYTRGTYEQLIYERARRRAEMMRALLGAGCWLNEDIDIEPNVLKQYTIDLSPRRAIEDDLGGRGRSG